MGKSPQCPSNRGLGGPTAGLDALEKFKGNFRKKIYASTLSLSQSNLGLLLDSVLCSTNVRVVYLSPQDHLLNIRRSHSAVLIIDANDSKVDILLTNLTYIPLTHASGYI
jgi:hypothetical protein